jgi:itaconate CoA-transferase
MHPLAGITVVSLEQAVAAPFASRQLADLGARVIKIERPGTGDFSRHYDTKTKGLSSYFVWLNRSKESLSLNLKHPEAINVMTRLLEQADVFVQNLVPGAIDRLGLGSETLRARFPQLITCSISGYGPDGPYREKRAYDLLIQAETGVVSLTGTNESPAKVGISIADIAAGVYAYSGILTALLVREKTGQGRHLEVSLFDALGEWVLAPAYYAYDGVPPRRTGAAHAIIAPYGPYPTGDKGTVFIAIHNEFEWDRFCRQVLAAPDLVEDPRFTDNPARVEHRTELDGLIETVFETYTTTDLIERLDAAEIAWGQQRGVEDFVHHPQRQARDRFDEVDSPAGPLWVLRPPVEMEGIEPLMGSIPAAGQHTASILAELGYEPAEIERLRESGMI